MATAVVKRPITQQSTSSAMPPLPPPTAGKDQSRPVSAVPPAGGPASESWSEYSHYNSKLTIENFDLLKVRNFFLCNVGCQISIPILRITFENLSFINFNRFSVREASGR
jgi:hypothetical protein